MIEKKQMNLFEYVKAFGTSKGFVGKSFWSPEFEIYKCAVCKKQIKYIQVTCSKNCYRTYRKQMNKTQNCQRYYNTNQQIKKLDKDEFFLLIQQKYGGLK